MLAALSLPPFGLWPLGFAALTPLLVAISGPGVRRSEVASAGVAFGLVFYGGTLHWLPPTLHGMVPLGAAVGVGSILVLALVAGLQVALLGWIVSGGGSGPLRLVLATPAVWVSVEYLLAHAGPLAFPWTPLGLSLSAAPGSAGIAEWVGVEGLSFWIAAANGAVAAGIISRPVGRRRSDRVGLKRGLPWSATALATAIVLLMPIFVGTRMVARPPPTTVLPPVLVGHLDVSRADLIDPVRRDAAAGAAIDRLAEDFESASSSTDSTIEPPVVAILPEAPFARTLDAGVADRYVELARSLGIPVLGGVHAEIPANSEDPFDGVSGSVTPLVNGAVLASSDGITRIAHAKVRLVPAVETAGLVPGGPARPYTVGSLTLAVAICFESAFGSEIRGLRKAGADLLVNLTNDGWFRPRLFGGLSAAHAQHRAHLVLRTIETRMGAVRSSLGGEFLLVDPSGRVVRSRFPAGQAWVEVHPVTTAKVTGYVRFGAWVGPIVLVMSAALVVSRLGSLRARAPSASGGMISDRRRG